MVSLTGQTLTRGFCTLTSDLGPGYGGVSYIPTLFLPPAPTPPPQAKLQWKKCADMPVGNVQCTQVDVMEEKCSH